MESVKDEQVVELWIIFAYFSSNKIIELLDAIEKRVHQPIVHMIFSASSSNPIQDIVEKVISYSERLEKFSFNLIEKPLMHSKFFAAKNKMGGLMLYLGSGNLTNKAQGSNIESGVILTFKTEEADVTHSYINRLIRICNGTDAVNSIDDLKRRAIFSHIRSELLFLALEESKVNKTIFISPSKLKKLLDKTDLNNEVDKNITIKTRKTLSISILKPEDKNQLIELEKNLKGEIKKTCAIKLDGYGWISSYWSLRSVFDENSAVKKAYDDFKKGLSNIRDKYKINSYRIDLAENIRHELYENISYSHNFCDEVEEFLKRFTYDVSNEKSPYRSLEKLYKKTSDISDISFLLNPYKISDEEKDEDHDINIPSIDHFNLMVICKLAIKLRSEKSIPKAPAVWWFDFALDKDAFRILGFDQISTYKKQSKKDLDEIIDEIQDIENKNINECLDKFCKITGFNLSMKYPIVYKLISHSNELENDLPYCFIDSEKKYFNLDNIENLGDMIFSLDKNKMPSGFKMRDFSLTLNGRFIMGDNLKFSCDEDVNRTYLYVNALYPDD